MGDFCRAAAFFLHNIILCGSPIAFSTLETVCLDKEKVSLGQCIPVFLLDILVFNAPNWSAATVRGVQHYLMKVRRRRAKNTNDPTDFESENQNSRIPKSLLGLDHTHPGVGGWSGQLRNWVFASTKLRNWYPMR